jgi:predicted amidohydrolase YtcJ
VPSLLIFDAERYPTGDRVDVRISDGRIALVARNLARAAGERVIDAHGGALLPGLHDHHIHLFALAAARASVQCGPPAIAEVDALVRELRAAPGAGWLRGVGYHESVAGVPDRWTLDAWVPERPLRIQHASGKAWFVNSAGLRELRLDSHPELEGVERDADGAPTGRLYRLDDWLRTRLAARDTPDVAAVSAELAAYGVTGITDTSATNDESTVALFADAIARGRLVQRVRLMGADALRPGPRGTRLEAGELKVLLDDDRLPDLDELSTRIRHAHANRRGVAFHCVSRAEIVFALGALAGAGSLHDRIEHAGVAPPELFPLLQRTGATVVTQPAFIAERGDRYLRDAERDDVPHLYRLRSFLAHGIALGLSSDAPYGTSDPWSAMRAAVSRRTADGVVIGADEALTPETALAGFLSAAHAPGTPQRNIEPGAPADLCLLDRAWQDARTNLHSHAVRLTLIAGEIAFERTPA